MPPLRDATHRDALIEGLKDGTIDMVTSDHNPLDIERKFVEFDNAMYGVVSQEATFKALISIVDKQKAIQLLTAGRKRFLNASYSIENNSVANLTLFTTEGKHMFTESDVLSKSKNAIFINQELNGEVYGVISNNQLVQN